MSDSKVLVTANKEGHVIVISKNNKDYGHIRVEQQRMVSVRYGIPMVRLTMLVTLTQ